MRKKKQATGSGRDPSRKRNSTSMTGVMHPVRDDPHNNAQLIAIGRRVPTESHAQIRDLVFESAHEKDCLVVLDVGPNIDRLETQPATWQLESGRRYTPDIRASGPVIRTRVIEVKPKRILNRDPTLDGRRVDIEAYAEKADVDFQVHTEDNYRSGARLENAHLLRHSARRNMPVARARVIEEMKKRPDGATLHEIVLSLKMGIDGRFAVLGLVALGILTVNIDERIGPDSVVRWRETSHV